MISPRTKLSNTQHHVHLRRMNWVLNKSNSNVWISSTMFCPNCQNVATVFLDSCSICSRKFTFDEEEKTAPS